VGTTVKFTSSSSRTGFVVDFGETDPFEQVGTIMGGADKPVTVIAKRPGCYTYTIGACTAGTVSGMCGNAVTQLIISAP
jgi:plastocyanin